MVFRVVPGAVGADHHSFRTMVGSRVRMDVVFLIGYWCAGSGDARKPNFIVPERIAAHIVLAIDDNGRLGCVPLLSHLDHAAP